ncbi:MAG: hypothetical protein JEY79_12205 [Pseudodesulfovibrio sp.]|nr:hypothetical protein [Pseudodesulfovibrio sp.]
MTRLTMLLLALTSILMLAACRTAPVYNVNDAAVPSPQNNPLTMPQIEEAIVKAGAGLGWNMRAIKPGLVEATLNIRAHQAVVNITYNQKDYNIVYKSSSNLKYNGTKIHSNYNGWVKNLSQAINNNLATKQYQ